ncbi:Probable RNA methyltransferase At5g51130 [Linum perenne]
MAESDDKRDDIVVGEKKRKRHDKKQNKDHQTEEDVNNGPQAEETQKQNGEQKPLNHQIAGANKKKKKQRIVFPFGNYRNYYGYRIGEGLDEDPRLKVFKTEWFQGKDCLDIGCNSGIITIHIGNLHIFYFLIQEKQLNFCLRIFTVILRWLLVLLKMIIETMLNLLTTTRQNMLVAKKFNCQSILGIDIDPDRISDAYWHLRKHSRELSGSSSTNVSKEQIREKLNASKKGTQQVGEDKEMEKDASVCKGKNLFDVVSFRQENFVENHQSHQKPYDVILCLSVAKWIHLNWGDDGLINLFTKVWKLLLPGGIFILEPQPWESYQKNYQVSKTAAENYRNIMFRPDCFREILLDKVGFRSVEDLTSGLKGSKTGFNRPIFAFHK